MEDQSEVESVVRNFPSTLAALVYRYGYLSRRGDNPNRTTFTVWELEPSFDRLRFAWNIAYGCLTLYVYEQLANGESARIFEDKVLVRGQASHETRVEVVKACERMILLFMPTIKQSNSYRYCECPVHKATEIDGEAYSTPTMCTRVGDKWLCDDCVDMYSLRSENPILANTPVKERSERDKMNAALRFKVLERDGFTCKSCGRNAREDRVKLHVDHIVAIANGGKTELDNLHTLCQDCNLGKSDKRVEQMELWK